MAALDEDSVTMAVSASQECLRGLDRKIVDGLIFSSTTSPYAEKQLASLIALAIDLRPDIFTLDIGGSLKAGTDALKVAVNMVKAGGVRNVLVVAADCRTASPGSSLEMSLGDGASAILVGMDDVLAEFEDSFSIANEMMDIWRASGQSFVKTWEERFIAGQGYQTIMIKAMKGLMEKQGLKSSDYHRLALYAPDMRSLLPVVKELRFDIKSQIQDPFLSNMGNIGTPQPLLLLGEILKRAHEGERVMVASYGGGGEALSFMTTGKVSEAQRRRGSEEYLKSQRNIPDYLSYLKSRGLIQQDPPRPEFGSTASSATSIWRERDQLFGLKGARCKSCKTVQFPPQRVCVQCHTKDQFELIRLSDSKGKLFSFSRDVLSDTLMGMIDFDEGGRMFDSLTDCCFEELEVDMPVVMQFRKTFFDGEKQNYFWKISPLRFNEEG
ncbi:MAG: zinc ribbon domain-containing protein [Syntrophales bacterium]|nr:zinc ribbon domain-containing protein [Syntrophales bacterium]